MVALTSCLIGKIINFILSLKEYNFVYAWTTLGNRTTFLFLMVMLKNMCKNCVRFWKKNEDKKHSYPLAWSVISIVSPSLKISETMVRWHIKELKSTDPPMCFRFAYFCDWYKKYAYFEKKNHILKLSSFCTWRIGKQAKLSYPRSKKRFNIWWLFWAIYIWGL